MVPLFDDIAVFHKQDVIRVTDCREAVSDYKACSAAHQLLHCLSNFCFRTCIYAGSSLIQYDDRRIAEEHAGNGNQLPLAY